MTARANQVYEMAPKLAWLAGERVTLPVTTTLHVDKNGQVLRHHDAWEGRGATPAPLRRLGSTLTDWMLRATGTKPGW